MKTCKDCYWWKKWTHLSEQYLEKTPQYKNRGDCHKNAPVVAGLSEEGCTCWPDTDATDFCGELSLKIRN